MVGRTKSVFGLLSVFAVLSSGCGTLHNLPRPGPAPMLGPGDPGSRTYGGVRADWDMITGKHFDDEYRLVLRKFTAPIFALDLPLTLIGDTLTLPYTLAYDCGLFGKRCIYAPPKDRDEQPIPASCEDGSGNLPSKALLPWPRNEPTKALAGSQKGPSNQACHPASGLPHLD